MKVQAQEDGFTLVELLISLALLSLMAIYAIQTFTTLRTMNRIESDMASQMEVDAVARLLRRELSDARAVFQQQGTANEQLYFIGAENTLAYVTESNGEREAGGLYYVAISLDSTGTLTAKRQLLGIKLYDHINEVVLLRGVSKLSFSYVGDTATTPDWQAINQLPKAIAAHVEFQGGDKRRWSDILVRLQTSR
jgi:general secretion pathway protein J